MEAALYSVLLDDAILDIAIEQTRIAKNRKLPCESCGYACKDHPTGHVLAVTSVDDGSGNVVPSKPENITLDCVSCSRKIASTRYAQHLSQCMGLTGRSRNSKRSAAATPMDLDSDASSAQRRKKPKLNGKANGSRFSSRMSQLDVLSKAYPSSLTAAVESSLRSETPNPSQLSRTSSSPEDTLSQPRNGTARKQMPGRPTKAVEHISSNSSASDAELDTLSSDSD